MCTAHIQLLYLGIVNGGRGETGVIQSFLKVCDFLSGQQYRHAHHNIMQVSLPFACLLF